MTSPPPPPHAARRARVPEPAAAAGPAGRAPARTQPHARPQPLLPPARDTDRPLFLVVAILAALACAAAIGARITWSASARWTADLDAAMTLYVPPGGAEDAAGRAGRAALIAAEIPGVATAEAMPRADAEGLLAAWLGDDLPDDLPMPTLVDVRLHARADRADIAGELHARLGAAGLEATLDDHSRWAGPLRRAAGAARALALGLLALTAGAAAAVTGFATRAGLAARAEVVNVLHLVGARDGFIAGEFSRRFAGLGLRAGALGALIAASGASALQLVAGGAEGDVARFAPVFALTGWDAMILGLAPFAAAGVAALTARATVITVLERTY